ncbi:MAG: 6-bladed beta-propeller [Gammaproteobacteria bacterium]|nr:6-bladed beta-propeller [Gammaproteobacteria bacterium]
MSIATIPNLHALDLPELGLTLLHSTLEGLDLVEVVGAVLLPDSSLVIADKASPNLTFLHPDGSLRARVGRAGEGPGEYTEISRIGLTRDGSLFAYDRALRRFTFLDREGGVIGVQRSGCTAATGEVVPLADVNGQGFIGVLETRPDLPPGVQRGPLFLVACAGIEESLDTLGEWAGKERHVAPNQWTAVGFGRSALYDGRGGRTVVGANDSLDLTLYEGSAVRTRVRGGSSLRRVTPAEREEWTSLYLEMFPEIVRADRRRRLEQSEIRDAYPAFGSIKVDADGGMWIGDYAKLSDDRRLWTVLGEDGTPVASIHLPVFRPDWLQIREGSITGRALVEWEVTIPSPVHELLDIADDRIVVLRKDELGREFVEVYEVEMPGEGQ